MSELYRVRKTWADAKSQIGAYKDLANAKTQAEKYSYNVYNSAGKLVYSAVKNDLYRVRKVWTDADSQVGAYKDLNNAKSACDKHPGYSVFDANGNKLYTSKAPAPTPTPTGKATVAFHSFTFGQAGDSTTLRPKYTGTPVVSSSNTKVATVTTAGIIKAVGAGTATIKFNDQSIKVTVAPALSLTKAMVPLVNAAKAQASYSYKSTYKWQSNPTIDKSRTNGTCVTYVACVFQRLGMLPSGKYFWHNGRGYGDGKVTGYVNSNFTVKYLNNKRPSALKNELKLGDAVLHDDNKSGVRGDGGHIEIYAGEINSAGKAKFFTGGYGSGHNTSINAWNTRTILAVVRPKTFSVKTYCIDGTITLSSLNLAAQNVTIKYSPDKGKKLKQILVDGKDVDITKYPSSYTFKSISTNHVIKVVYA